MTTFDKFIIDALYPALRMLIVWIEHHYKNKSNLPPVQTMAILDMPERVLK